MISSNAGRLMLVNFGVLVALFCNPLRAAEDEPIKVSAKDLASAYVKDLNSAIKKYGDSMNPKEVIVDGVVAAVIDGKYGKIARLTGTGKTVVSCLMNKQDAETVKKGDKVSFKGKCRGYFKQENLVDLNGGVLVKPEK